MFEHRDHKINQPRHQLMHRVQKTRKKLLELVHNLKGNVLFHTSAFGITESFGTAMLPPADCRSGIVSRNMGVIWPGTPSALSVSALRWSSSRAALLCHAKFSLTVLLSYDFCAQ